MHNSEARRRKERQKEQIKQRYNVVIDPENYEYMQSTPSKNRPKRYRSHCRTNRRNCLSS